MTATTKFAYTQEEAQKMYPAFFEKYGALVSNKIPDIVKHCFDTQKLKLRNVFPFDGFGRAVMVEYADSNIKTLVETCLPNTLMTIKNLCYLYDGFAKVNTLAVIEGRVPPSNERLAKKLLAAHTNSPHRSSVYRLKEYDLCLELPRLPLAKRYDLECILQNFYSEVAKLRDKKLQLVLSVNPYDILNAGNARFKSCNSLGGAYEQAPISVATSEYMAILRLEIVGGDMVGRNYMSFGPDFKSIVVQPTYGFMSSAYIEDALAWITLMIDEKFPAPANLTKPPVWKRRNRGVTDSLPRAETISNAKFGVFYTDPTRELLYRSDCEEYMGLRVGDCVCLFCGKKSTSLMCPDCRSKFVTCAECRAVYTIGDNATSIDKQWCPTCRENLRTCKKCNREFYVPPNADTEHVVHNYCKYCYCVSARCLLCEHLHNTSLNVLTEGHDCIFSKKAAVHCHNTQFTGDFIPLIPGVIGVHKSCAERNLLICRKCGTASIDINPHSLLCSKCDILDTAKYSARNTLGELRVAFTHLKSGGTVYDNAKVKILGSLKFPSEEAAPDMDYSIAA